MADVNPEGGVAPHEPVVIRLGHSPDPDDAFMFYGIACGGVDVGRYRFEHVLADIQTLNEWAREGRLEVTAMSLHAYAYTSDRYALLPNGASIGDKYGPIVVAREPRTLESLRGCRIAVPGTMTTAYLVLRLALADFDPVIVPFDTILDVVRDGQADAGCVIHEGQLTFGEHGLHKVLDLGEWWHETEGLPLPLGVDTVRRDLGPRVCSDLARILEDSIRYAMDHRHDALVYAGQYGRGLDLERTDRFVGMYVNQDTLDYGERGREGVRRVLQRGLERGLVPGPVTVEFIPMPERVLGTAPPSGS